MPTPATAPLRPLYEFARDAAVQSAVAAIPVGRLHGAQVIAYVGVSAAATSVLTFRGLQAAAQARTATPDGWMPWVPRGQAAPALPSGTAGDAAGPGGQDRRALVRRLTVAAVAGTVAGGVVAAQVAVDKRMEAFFTDRGVRRPRLAVGLSQGIGYAALIALLGAAVRSRGDSRSVADDG